MNQDLEKEKLRNLKKYRDTFLILEFDKVLELLCSYAVSDQAKTKLADLVPYPGVGEVKQRLKETTEGRKILDACGIPPVAAMKDLDYIITTSVKGALLSPEQLTMVAAFAQTCRRLKSYLAKAEYLELDTAFYGQSMIELDELQDEIQISIRNGSVDSLASNTLKNTRARIDSMNNQIQAKLDSILKGKKIYFSDQFVVKRNGRYVLPVKREYKHQVSGSVIDQSASGATYFIEPTAVSKLTEELAVLRIEEENEIRRILYELTSHVADYELLIRRNMEAMEILDIVFAKARLSADMEGQEPSLTKERRIRITEGRHPLLNRRECVPLEFEMGTGNHGVVITGPNTGGKTVALKTIGLFSIMVACGLHVPAHADSEFCLYDGIYCDIGDGQSITENLSTFSSHITKVVEIMKKITPNSLVLMDELGSGTDPAEGMGIAIAILEELQKSCCLFMVTTHYPEVKDFTEATPGLINARMAFDKESLRPLYRLEVGHAGESCALYIARRLGMPASLLKRAYEEAYGRTLRITSNKNVVNSPETDTSLIGIADNEKENQVLNYLNEELEREKTEGTPEKEKKDDSAKTIWSKQKETMARQRWKENQKTAEQTEQQEEQRITHKNIFSVGDSVMVYPEHKLGIVYELADEKGNMTVQVQGRKLKVSHKRVKLKTAAKELYPEDYDMSIIFENVAVRKARHKMDKGYQPGLEIETDNTDIRKKY